MSKNIVFEGWLTKSPPMKRIWRTVSRLSNLHLSLLTESYFVCGILKVVLLFGVMLAYFKFEANFLMNLVIFKFNCKVYFVGVVEMAEKVVCLAAVRRAAWPIFSRLLCGPELQAAQGHHQLRFVRTGN